jgi:hypothetical protein
MVLKPLLDTKNYRGKYNRRAKTVVKDLMEEFQLRDIWRDDNQNKHRYTWKQSNPIKMSRIDMYTLNINSNINTGYRTDHCMITL